MTKRNRLDRLQSIAIQFIDDNDLEDGWYQLAEGIELYVWEDAGVIKYDMYSVNPEDGDIDRCRIKEVKIATMQD